MERESKEPQMACQKGVKTVDSDALQKNWRERVNVGHSYAGYRQDVIKMLQEHEHMWYRRLSRVWIAEAHMQITSTDTQLFNSTLNRAGQMQESLKRRK